MNSSSVLRTNVSQCIRLERNMKRHLVLSFAHKHGTSSPLMSACIPLVMEDSLLYKSCLVDSWLCVDEAINLPVAGYPRTWLQLKESSDWLEPPSPSL